MYGGEGRKAQLNTNTVCWGTAEGSRWVLQLREKVGSECNAGASKIHLQRNILGKMCPSPEEQVLGLYRAQISSKVSSK